MYYGDCENNKTYQNLRWKYQVRPRQNLSPEIKTQRYLTFTSQDICMIFTVNVGYDMEIVKILKLTKMHCRNARSEHAQMASRNKLKLPFIYLARYMYYFYCRSSLQYGNWRKAKLTKIFGGNPRSNCVQGWSTKRLTISLPSS